MATNRNQIFVNDGGGKLSSTNSNQDKDKQRKFYRAYKAGLLDENKITNDGWKNIYEYELEQGYSSSEDISPSIASKYGINTSIGRNNSMNDTIDTSINSPVIEPTIETPKEEGLVSRLLSFLKSGNSDASMSLGEYRNNTILPKNKIEDLLPKKEPVNTPFVPPSTSPTPVQELGVRPRFGNKSLVEQDDPLLMALNSKLDPKFIGEHTKQVINTINTNRFNKQLEEQSKLNEFGVNNPYLPKKDNQVNIPQNNLSSDEMDSYNRTKSVIDTMGDTNPLDFLKAGAFGAYREAIGRNAQKNTDDIIGDIAPMVNRGVNQDMARRVTNQRVEDREYWTEDRMFNAFLGKPVDSEIGKGESVARGIGGFAGNLGKMMLFSQVLGPATTTKGMLAKNASLGALSRAESSYSMGEDSETIVKDALIGAGSFAIGELAGIGVTNKLTSQLVHTFKTQPQWANHLTALVRTARGVTDGTVGTLSEIALSNAMGKETEIGLKEAIQSGLIMGIVNGVTSYIPWGKLNISDREMKDFNIKVDEVDGDFLKSNGYIKLSEIEGVNPNNPYINDLFINPTTKDIVVSATRDGAFLVPTSMVQDTLDSQTIDMINRIQDTPIRQDVDYKAQPDYIDKMAEPKKYAKVLNQFMENEGYKLQSMDGQQVYAKYNQLNTVEGDWEIVPMSKAEQKFENEYFTRYKNTQGPSVEVGPRTQQASIGKFDDSYEVNRSAMDTTGKQWVKDMQDKGYSEYKPGVWVKEVDGKIVDIVPEFTVGKGGKAIPVFDIKADDTNTSRIGVKGFVGGEYDLDNGATKQANPYVDQAQSDMAKEISNALDNPKLKGNKQYDQFVENITALEYGMKYFESQGIDNASLDDFISKSVAKNSIKMFKDFINGEDVNEDELLSNMRKFNNDYQRLTGMPEVASKQIKNATRETIDNLEENIVGQSEIEMPVYDLEEDIKEIGIGKDGNSSINSTTKFEEGQRVEFITPEGETLSGTIRYLDEDEEEATIKVDSTSLTESGIPIGRVEYVKFENIKNLEKNEAPQSPTIDSIEELDQMDEEGIKTQQVNSQASKQGSYGAGDVIEYKSGDNVHSGVIVRVENDRVFVKDSPDAFVTKDIHKNSVIGLSNKLEAPQSSSLDSESVDEEMLVDEIKTATVNPQEVEDYDDEYDPDDEEVDEYKDAKLVYELDGFKAGDRVIEKKNPKKKGTIVEFYNNLALVQFDKGGETRYSLSLIEKFDEKELATKELQGQMLRDSAKVDSIFSHVEGVDLEELTPEYILDQAKWISEQYESDGNSYYDELNYDDKDVRKNAVSDKRKVNNFIKKYEALVEELKAQFAKEVETPEQTPEPKDKTERPTKATGQEEDKKATEKPIEAPASVETLLKDAKTGKVFTTTLYHGQGATKEEVYNVLEKPILGEGKYYATSEKEAKFYGDNVTTEKITLNNPLVIDSDTEWRKLTMEAKWRFPNPIGMDKEIISSYIDDMNSLIKSKGYDGVVIRLQKDNDYTKTMYNLFSHDQVVVFGVAKDNNKGIDTVTKESVTLDDYDIQIVDTTTKNNTEIWHVKGNTFEYKDILGKNGMKGMPYGRGRNFVWSFKKSQYPTREDLEKAILDKLPPLEPKEEVSQSTNQEAIKNEAQEPVRATDNTRVHDYSKDYFIKDVIENISEDLQDISDNEQINDIIDGLRDLGYISGLEDNLVQQSFVKNVLRQELMADGLVDDFYDRIIKEIRRLNEQEVNDSKIKGVENSGPSKNQDGGTEERDRDTKDRDNKTGQRNKPTEPTSGKIRTTQTNNDDDIQDGDEPISIDQDGYGGAIRDDSVNVSGDEGLGVPENVIAKPISEVERSRKNLKLDVGEDWLQNTFNSNGTYTTAKLRREMNEKALKILDKPIEEITEEDKQILKNYTGKGGLGATGKEILTQYFTDYNTVDVMYRKIEQMGFSLDNVKALDPSTGVGVFMGLAPDGVQFDAIDLDPIVATISSILYPDSNVMTKGFEEHRIDNEYDLVITNVPFLDSRGAGIIKDKPNIRNLHDYFVLASLDKAKNNGLVALITPSSVMDAIDPKVRHMINKDAEFLGAYRLPSGVFDKTGTDAITDIIFLRRRVRNSVDEDIEFANNELFLRTEMIGKEDLDLTWGTNVKSDDLIPINSYYIKNPANLLGSLTADTNRYGQNVIKVSGKLDEKQINKILNDDIKYARSQHTSDESVKVKTNASAIYFEAKDADITPVGGIFEKDNKWYIRSQVKGTSKVIIDKGMEVELDKKEIETTRALLDVASLSQSLRVSARNKVNEKELKKMTDDLYNKVESFRSKHLSQFETPSYKQKLSTDPRYYIIKVLLDSPDIFNKDTLSIRDYEIDLKDRNNLNTLSQHLIYQYGEITVENFAENYQSGISEKEARNILDSSDMFFKQPSIKQIEHFDKHGNVEIEEVKSTPNSYERSIDYLSGNIYKKIELVERELELGNEEYQKNLDALKKAIPEKKTLNDVRLSVKQKWIDTSVIEDFLINYLDVEKASIKLNELNQYEVKIQDYGNPKINKLRIDKFSFYEWFVKYLNGQSLNIMVNGNKDAIASSKATAQMRKIDDIFNQYLKATPDISNELMDKYNYIFNNYVEKEKEDIIIPGKNKDWKFRDNQIEFVNMALSVGTGVNAQRTGAGKTATNVAVNHMLKVTGRANKPMAIVPGKVIKKFVRDVIEGSRGLPSIFPDMKILDATDYNFNEAMARIAFNEWDLILIPDTWFKRISMTPEREMAYIEKQIADLKLSESKRATEKGNKRSQKAFEKALEKLQEKMAELRNYVKNDGIYFEDLGVDAISLDEAQSVKNLVTSVRGQDLGMSATPSQTAIDFNMKAKYIMEMKNGKNVFLYTATPVSNSILEIYGLLQNIAPQEWTNRGMFTVEDFIEAYCDTSETIGITKENEVGVINKVDGFINIDDLRLLFKKYVDYRPFIEGAIIPDLKDQRYIIPMAESQRVFFNDIMKRLELIKAKEPRELYVKADGEAVLDNVMTVLGDARRGSISMSLITGEMPTYANSPKIEKGVEIISKIYRETGKNQVVFLDQYGESILGKNNLHNFLKKELGKKGVPLNEIVIVNGKINNKVEDKLSIQDEFNDGKYKIIIGTTESIGAGMDLQEKTISIINLDIPWTPTSVTQRVGRGERPGNEHNLISNIDILIKGSYDAWSTNIVGVKKKWQDQLLEGYGDADGGYLKNQDDDSYDIDSIIGELIEDPIEKAKLNFEATRKSKLVQIDSIKDNIEKEKQNISAIDKAITDRKVKIERYEEDLGNVNRSKLATIRIEQHKQAIQSLEEELEETYKRLERHETQLMVESDSYDDYVNKKEDILSEMQETSKKDVRPEASVEELIEELKTQNKIKTPKTKSTSKNSNATRRSIPNAETMGMPKSERQKPKKIKPISEIIKGIEQDFNTSISSKRYRDRRGAIGQYQTHSESIRVKTDNKIQTIAHELGHHFDKKYNLSTKYKSYISAMEEGLSLSDQYKPEEIPGEVIAEFIRLYLVTENKAYELSPEFYNAFLKELDNKNLKNLKKHKKSDNKNLKNFNKHKDLDNKDLENLKKHREDILNWYASDLMDRGQSTIRSHTEKKKTSKDSKKLNLEMTIFDDLAPIRLFSETVEKYTGEKLRFNQHPYVLAMQSRRAGMIAKSQIIYAQTDAEGNIIGESFKELLKDISKDKMKAFDDYLKVSHAITLYEYGKQVYSDDFAIEDMQLMKTTYELDNPQFAEVAQGVYKWWNRFVEEWVVKQGFLTPDVWADLKERYPTYVPNFRYMEEENYSSKAKRGFGNQRSPIGRMKGSAKDTYSVIESLLIYTDKIVKTQKRNEVGLAVHNLYQKVEGLGDILTKITHETQLNKYNAQDLKATLTTQLITDYIDSLEGTDKDKANKLADDGEYEELMKFLTAKGFAGAEIVDNTIDDIITFFTPRMFSTDNGVYTIIDTAGKTHFYEVHDSLFLEAMLNLSDKSMDKVTRMIGAWKRMFTNLTTGANPIFGITSNIWGDVPQAFLYGQYKNPLEFGVDLGKAMKNIFTGNEKAEAYYAMGGGMSSPISENRQLMTEMLNKLFPEMKKSGVKSMVDYIIGQIEQFNDTIESAPRLTEFTKVMEKYGDTYEGRLRAIYEASEVTTNFLRHGRMQYTIIGQGVPFLNAGLQGMYKLHQEYIARKGPGRNDLTGDGDRKKDNKRLANIMLKALFAITVFEIIQMIAYKDDEEYNNLAEYLKDGYWLIKYDDGKFIRIKKPRAEGMIFGSMFRRGFKQGIGDKEAWDGFADTFFNTFMPPNPLTDNIFAGVIGVGRNKTWSGNPIVPVRLQNLPPLEQYDISTSSISKAVTQVLNKATGIETSPKNIDYLIQQYTGIIGQVLLPATTETTTVADSIKRKMTTDLAFSNKVVNEFYENKEKLDSAYTLYNQKGVKNKDFDPVLRYRYNQVNKEMSDIWGQINDLKENPALSQTEKKEKERVLRLQLLELANPENLKPTSYDEFKVLYNRGQDITSKYKEQFETTKTRPQYTKEEQTLLELYNVKVDGTRSQLGAINYQLTQINKRRKQVEGTNTLTEANKQKALKKLDDSEKQIVDKYMEFYRTRYNIDINKYF